MEGKAKPDELFPHHSRLRDRIFLPGGWTEISTPACRQNLPRDQNEGPPQASTEHPEGHFKGLTNSFKGWFKAFLDLIIHLCGSL